MVALYALLLGLGATRLTELWKEVAARMGVYQAPWFKAALNIVICAVGGILVLHEHIRTEVLVIAGAAGISMLAHAVDTCLRHYRDRLATEVLEKSRARRR